MVSFLENQTEDRVSQDHTPILSSISITSKRRNECHFSKRFSTLQISSILMDQRLLLKQGMDSMCTIVLRDRSQLKRVSSTNPYLNTSQSLLIRRRVIFLAKMSRDSSVFPDTNTGKTIGDFTIRVVYAEPQHTVSWEKLLLIVQNENSYKSAMEKEKAEAPLIIQKFLGERLLMCMITTKERT